MVQLTAYEAAKINKIAYHARKYSLGDRIRALEGGSYTGLGTEAQLTVCDSGGVPTYRTVSGDVTINGTGVTAIGANKVLYSMLSQNNRRFVATVRIAADSAAADTWERAAFMAPAAVTVVDAGVVPDASFGQATNFATIAVQNKGTSGAGTTAVASKAFSTSVSAYDFTSLGTITNASIAADEVLTFKATKTASGQIVPAGLLVLVLERAA